MTRDVIMFLDNDGDIIDYLAGDPTSDTVFSLVNKLSRIHGEEIRPYYAVIQTIEEYKQKIHTDKGVSKPAVSIKVPLDICHQHGLCSDLAVKASDLILRCSICPRRDK